MRWLFILLLTGLTGCVTDHEIKHDARDQSSGLTCIGYCDLLITDKSAEINADGKTEFKHGPKQNDDDKNVKTKTNLGEL